MKYITVFLAILAVTTATVKVEWTAYKTHHEKNYHGEEDEIRFAIWEANKEMVEAHNAAGHSWTMALYEWSDWTTEEFEEKMLGYKPNPNVETLLIDETIPRAQDIDYRDEGKVTAVKDQGQCGSCWAFSASGSLEGLWKHKMGKLVSISEQQMLDCGEGGGSCNGGTMCEGWFTARNGIESEQTYPYEAKDGDCRYDSSKQVAHASGFLKVGESEDQLLSTLAAIGYPISVAVAVGPSWQHYSGGIFSDPSCANNQRNHGVLAVGYNKSGATPYWIVKNSWGLSFGESGYIRAKIGENFCGISDDATYPTLG